MSLFEYSPLPGAPYLVAAVLSIWSFLHCFELPPEPDLVYAKFHANNQTLPVTMRLRPDDEADEAGFEYVSGGIKRKPNAVEAVRLLASQSDDTDDSL